MTAHLGLDKQAPAGRAKNYIAGNRKVVSMPRLEASIIAINSQPKAFH
jgi:hypothetical protein